MNHAHPARLIQFPRSQTPPVHLLWASGHLQQITVGEYPTYPPVAIHACHTYVDPLLNIMFSYFCSPDINVLTHSSYWHCMVSPTPVYMKMKRHIHPPELQTKKKHFNSQEISFTCKLMWEAFGGMCTHMHSLHFNWQSASLQVLLQWHYSSMHGFSCYDDTY